MPEEVPTIAVEPPRTPQQMERAIKGLVTGRYEWIAFTSRNAVKAVREQFEEYGLDARAFAGIKVAAVGEQTAADLLAWGIKPDLVPSGEQSAAGLLEDWPPYDAVLDPIDRVFLPRADIATETLVAGLVELGWEVDDVTAYRTVRAAPPAAPSPRGDQERWVRRGACSRRPPPCATWSASPASRTPRRSSPASGRRRRRRPRSTACASTSWPPSPSVADLATALAEYGAALRSAARRGRRAGAAPVAEAHVGPAEGHLTGAATSRPSRPAGRAGCAGPPRCAAWSPRPGRRAADLVLPLFVKEGATEPVPIASMPGVVQHTRDSLRKAAVEARAGGRRRADALRRPANGVTPIGTGATDPGGVLNVALRDVVAEVGDDIVVMADLCLDEFTDHGHCGVLAADGTVDNDATLRRYADMALAQAAAGAHVLGLCGMMDGQVGAVRGALDGAGARRRRAARLHREVRLGLLRPVPRGRASRRCRVTGAPTSRTPPTRTRRCARSRSTSPRARTS